MRELLLTSDSNGSWLADLKQRIQSAQQRGYLDEKLKSDEDKPTMGLLLCKQYHRVVAAYAVRGMTQPIGIAEYKLQPTLAAWPKVVYQKT